MKKLELDHPITFPHNNYYPIHNISLWLQVLIRNTRVLAGNSIRELLHLRSTHYQFLNHIPAQMVVLVG